MLSELGLGTGVASRPQNPVQDTGESEGISHDHEGEVGSSPPDRSGGQAEAGRVQAKESGITNRNAEPGRHIPGRKVEK